MRTRMLLTTRCFFLPLAPIRTLKPLANVPRKYRRGEKLALHWLLLLLLLSFVNGCKKAENSAAIPAPPPSPPPSVKIAQPLVQDVTEWDEFTGHIEAINTVHIKARVSGYLEKVNFTAGKKVKKGELLFQIDPKPLQVQLDLANAELEQAKTKQALAKNDFIRAKNLLNVNAIAVEEFDMRNKGLREAMAAIQAAEANVAANKLNLDYTQIRAPIDGRVGREMITAGNLVNSGGDATLLTTIVSIDPVYVYVDADERSVLKYKRQNAQGIVGKPVELTVADETGFKHKGSIDYLAPQANAATGTISLRGVFSNTDELLSPGFFARVRLRAGAPYKAILLPDRAIATDQAQRFVWVVKADNQVEYRKVELGATIGKMRVITAGVTAEDAIITDGLQKIKPGITVQPEKITLVQE